MGRKGIGKLAGFGIAKHVAVTTWRDGSASCVDMPLAALVETAENLGQVKLAGEIEAELPAEAESIQGTRVVLTQLKQKTAISPEDLRQALGRRFSRNIAGEMEILVNSSPIEFWEPEYEFRVPEVGQNTESVDGKEVRYYYGFARSVIRPASHSGFAVLVNGKTAQKPPFFFDVEAVASGQHGTKYLHGVVEADFLDSPDGIDPDEADLISTDRQELDWEHEATAALHVWGDALARKALRDYRDWKGDKSEDWLGESEEISRRLEALDPDVRARVSKIIRTLGNVPDADRESIISLAGSVISAFEFRHFHDFVQEMDSLADDPEALAELVDRLRRWKVLESRALLEVVEGRLSVIRKFRQMIAEDAPETAGRYRRENLHDLVVAFPWLLNPKWQVLDHEREVSGLLSEWKAEDFDPENSERIDFLSLTGEGRLVVVEIKRAGIAAELKEFQKLQEYVERLRRSDGSMELEGLFVASEFNFTPEVVETNAISIETWATVCDRVTRHFEDYSAILESDIENPGFYTHKGLVLGARRLETEGAYLNKSDGKNPLGPQSPPGGGDSN